MRKSYTTYGGSLAQPYITLTLYNKAILPLKASDLQVTN